METISKMEALEDLTMPSLNADSSTFPLLLVFHLFLSALMYG